MGQEWALLPGERGQEGPMFGRLAVQGFRCPSPQRRGHCAMARRGPRGVAVETGSQEPGVCKLIVTRNVLRDRVECLVLSSRRPEDLLPRVCKQPNLGP